MSIASDLYTMLTGDATVSGLIGARVYPALAPDEATWPAIVYQEISGVGEPSLSDHHPGLNYRYQLRLIDDRYLDLLTLVTAVLALSGGSQGAIKKVEIDEGPDDYDIETGLFSRILEARISA